MRFSCQQQDIFNAIQTVQRVTVRNSLPMYQYALIRAEECFASLVGVCGDETVITRIDTVTEQNGEILVPVALMREILAKLPSGSISFEVGKDNIMKVSYINMKFTIPCLDAISFDFTSEIVHTEGFGIKSEEFKSAIRQTYFTSIIQENRPVLGGIQMKREENSDIVTFVSTDATRIAYREVKLISGAPFDIILPARLIYDILSSSDKNDTPVMTVGFNDKFIMLQTGKLTFITGLISGKFINYQSLIPNSFSSAMISDRLTFLSIMERASLLSDETLYTVRFDINISKLYVSSTNDHGNGFEEIDIATEGAPLKVAFNSKNFIEILKNMDCQTVYMQFSSNTRICKISPVGESNLFYLIFPIRI